jgi:hypothetical protein
MPELHGFVPAELDRLEDALDDLEGLELDDPSPDDPVAQRLADYRHVMMLCREAMPLEDVPAGLLDGVLAQARQAVAAGPVTSAASPAPSFWARWRLGVWVPALAFAGSAALLLVMLVPERRDEAPSASSPSAPAVADAKVARGDQRVALSELDRAEQPAALDGQAVPRAGGLVIGEREPEPEPSPPPTALANEAEDQRRKADDEDAPEQAEAGLLAPAKPKPLPPTPSKTSPVPGSVGGLGGGKAGGAEKKDAGEDPWAELSRADADRRSGSCGLAKMRYDKLRKVDDARVRARALAGAGLCAAASGDPGTAKKLFAQARAADPSVGEEIDRELADLDEARAKADPSQAAH